MQKDIRSLIGLKRQGGMNEKLSKTAQGFAEAYAYDDLLLVPSYSDVLPHEADVGVSLVEGLHLHVPMLSSAMDTVTESAMAIAMALEGGLGVVHRSMSIASQCEEVRKVKRFQSGVIRDPVYVTQEATSGEAKLLMRRHGIGGVPIVKDTKSRILVGIITHRDLRFHESDNTNICSLMSASPITLPERKRIDYARAISLFEKKKIEKLPIVGVRGELRGLITYKDIMKRADRPYATKDKDGSLSVGAALGVVDYMERSKALEEAGVDVLCVDTAHAHTESVLKALKVLVRRCRVPIIAGNIATKAAATALASVGVQAVKVGMGPGSICTTRVITGVGVPQLSAIMEVSAALRKTGVGVIADGGIRFSGDIVKALAGGADAVMLGSLLAGTAEAVGETVVFQGKKYKVYRGMGSMEAMQQGGSSDRYFQQDGEQTGKLIPEGISGRVPYSGQVSEVLYQLVGGLRSGMGYVGAKDIASLQKANFVRVTSAGVQENHPHDVIITREAPNYSRW